MRVNQALAFRAVEICRFTEHKKGRRTYFTVDDEISGMVIDRLNEVIKRFYKVRQADRNSICSQVATLLKNSPPLNVVKIDLKSFYASINESKILNKIQNDRLLCPYTFGLLKSSICSDLNAHQSGLPEGICLSATLSELYLREADQSISKLPGCIYYARFVDDILILTNKCPDYMLKSACRFLEEFAMVHPNKVYTSLQNGNCDFGYLGYRFRRSSRNLEIEISQNKIQRIKTKVALSLLQFNRDHSIEDLFDRIRYITSNVLLQHADRSQPVKSGIFYNYSLLALNPKIADRQMRKLDMFLVRMLKAKRGRFGNCISILSKRDRLNILSNTFRGGFKNRKMCDYDSKRISKIVKPWKYA